MTATPSKMADSKGRITLGKEFANQLVIVKEIAAGVIQLIKAEAVPQPEVWLHRNPQAIKMVMEGIAQARRGELSDGPDLDKMEALADDMTE
jgi:hypothetical protein